MADKLQSLSFVELDIDDLGEVTEAFNMRKSMYLANGDPYTMFDHRFPNALAYADYLKGHQTKEFIVICGERIGFYAYSFNHAKNPNGAYVHMIYFDDTSRGKGYGRQVIERIKADCLEHNICSLVLHSKKVNITNAAIYSKLGFTCVGDVDETGFLLKWRMEI